MRRRPVGVHSIPDPHEVDEGGPSMARAPECGGRPEIWPEPASQGLGVSGEGLKGICIGRRFWGSWMVGRSLAGREFARKWVLESQLWTLLSPRADFGRGVDVRGPDAIRPIPSGLRESAPQPESVPERRIFAELRDLPSTAWPPTTGRLVFAAFY